MTGKNFLVLELQPGEEFTPIEGMEQITWVCCSPQDGAVASEYQIFASQASDDREVVPITIKNQSWASPENHVIAGYQSVGTTYQNFKIKAVEGVLNIMLIV
jgi:hypothetical protein